MTTTTPSLLSDTPARHTRSHDKSSATSSTASRAAAANNDDAYSSSSSPTLTAAPSPPPHGAFASEPSSATFRDSSSGSSTSSFATADENDDDELSDGEITRLLREAEDRMKYGGSALTLSTSNQSVVRLPKLNPGAALPKPPIAAKGMIARAVVATSAPQSLTLADDDLGVLNAATEGAGKKQKKEGPPPTAGAKWFDMPRTDLSSSTIKRDMEIIKARNVLDPHRHYKKDTSALPEYSQIGTIIEGNTEFHSSRIVKKERKKTIVDEILADGTSRDRFKRKYNEIQKGKKSGKKEHYKRLMEQRKKIKYAK